MDIARGHPAISAADLDDVEHAALAYAEQVNFVHPGAPYDFGHATVEITQDIPRSRDDPELRWVYDTEVVGDLIAVSAPVPGHVVAQEVQHCAAEVREGAVALVVGGMSVHQPP